MVLLLQYFPNTLAVPKSIPRSTDIPNSPFIKLSISLSFVRYDHTHAIFEHVPIIIKII